MTQNEDEYIKNLQISRNKLKLLLYHYLNSITDALIVGEDPILPIPFRSGFLVQSKNHDKFEIYFELMVEIYSNLTSGQVRTKRDMYYGNTSLFKSQSVLDSAIQNIAKAFNVPRDALNVVGAGKGVYFGELKMNGHLIGSNGINIIPRREEIESFDLLNTRFVLVVEKDAVMSVIIDNYAHLKRTFGSFLLVCGKGFPCMRTKQFMNLIETKYTSLPKFILVDNDPFGIDIVLNYISNSSEYETDSCASLQYIGVDHYDLDRFGIPSMTESISPSDLRRLETVKNRARKFKRFREIDEIKFMQNNLKKAEMEALYNPDCKAFCTRFLIDKLQGLLPTNQSMEEEDIALKKRLLVDERVLRKLSKKLLSSNEDGLKIEHEQMELLFDRNLAILASFERDWSQISTLSEQIEQGIADENTAIEGCKSDLIAAKKVLQNRLEYDQIAKEILSLQSRPELLNNIESVEMEMNELFKQIEVVDTRTQERNAECSQILESVQVLLESVNSDSKEFKQ